MEEMIDDYVKLVSSTKTKEEDQLDNQRQDLIERMRMKKECDTKALKIVQFLIEGKFETKVFLECLKYLNLPFYQDLVNERNINKCCGYCLCDNEIIDMKNKQYFLDKKNNRIFDITERKKYCSNYCYKASCHIEEQLDDTPFWLKDLKEIKHFTVLDLQSSRCAPGTEIKQNLNASTRKPSFTSIYSFAEASLKDLDEYKATKNINKEAKSSQNLNDNKNITESSSTAIHSPTTSKEHSHKSILKTATRSKTESNGIQHKSSITLTDLKKYIQEWITIDTYIYLYGETYVKEYFEKKGLQKYIENIKLDDSPVVTESKYIRMCQKLALIGCAEEKFDSKVLGNKLKVLPDYKTLKEESKVLNVKMQSFFSGQPYDLKDVDVKIKENVKVESKIAEEEQLPPPPVINLQSTIRHKTFMASLTKAVELVMPNFDIPTKYVLEELDVLVKTFKLQPYSVVFQPSSLWNLLSLFLIKLLTIHDSKLKTEMESQKLQVFVNQLMNHFPSASIIFCKLFEEIQDMDLFLQLHFNAHKPLTY